MSARTAIGIRLENCSGKMRALVVNALNEKARGDRDAALLDGLPLYMREELLQQADLAEQIADELEDP